LDPGWPAARREALLEDAGARISRGGGEGVPPDCAVLRLDREEAWSGNPPAAAPRPSSPVRPEQAAYVIYTSGSTGHPKGVMVGHGAAVRFALEVAERCGLGAEDRFLQFASPGFDVLIEEVFPVWSRGGAVVFADRRELLSPAGLERALACHGATALELPAPYWHEWVDDLERRAAAPPASLRLLLLGCEKPSLERLAAWRRHGIPLLHVFGLTETAVTSAVHFWDGRAPVARELPVGRPVGGSRLYVLDRDGAPVLRGAPGELFVGGAGVARGYLGQTALTAERFVPDPFSLEPGERLYRTGDLARHRPDGALDFLGRIDEQVKVRGFRVEPGEVAAALEQHPAVAEAFAAVRETRPGDRRLIAWVVPAAGGAVSPEALRDHLAARLPEHMVPSALVALPALPRTANGKIDRAALPLQERSAGTAEREGPRTPVEELLAGIWCEVLGLAAVGRGEDFFALGGHSLLATQAVSRMRRALGTEVPLRTLFEHPTVAALARAVEESRGGRSAPPIVPLPRRGDPPASFAQQRLWLLDQLDPGSAAYNIPGGVRLRGEVAPALLARTFAEVVRRHEVLRTTFAARGGGAVQRIAPPAGAPPELPLVDLSRLPEAEREAAARALARAEGERPFDLRRGPLLRLLLVGLGARDHLLLITLHHVVSDGWSTGVLIREVTALYEAFSEGRAAPLPELPVQYADFAVWQREWLRGEVLEEQLGVWRRRLAGAPQVLDLPTDRPRPAAQTFRGASRRVALPAGLSAAVEEVSRREGATPFMTLLTAWAVLLGRHAGQDDLLVGAPVAGRNREETEGLIGFFVNTLVLRIELTGAPTFAEALRRVREAALEAFTHQDLPFERLVEELAERRDPSRPPLIQVLFALQDGFAERLDLPGLELRPIEVEVHSARFDLVLSLGEGPEGLAGFLEHSTDLFDGTTAERLLVRYQVALEAATGDAGLPVAELPLLPVWERQQVLVEPNDTRSAYPREASLPELFAAVARELPEAPAIVGEHGEVWTYRWLDEESDRLARHLRSLGVGPEVAVGIAMERSADLILGTLAIVKAGGVYVPLDPSYPDERLSFLLADTAAPLVLVDEHTCKRLAALGGSPQLVEISGPLEPLKSLPSLTATALAYVLYTSGSTGRPKGVAVSHQAIVRLVRESDYVRLGPGDRVACLSNPSFDAATFEVWGALLNGATAVVVPRDVVLAPVALADLLRRERVTALFLTTALFNQVVREAPDAFSTVRQVLFGGEAVDPRAVARALEQEGPERLLHVYGPTESTTFATWHRVRAVAPGAATVPIGRPLANTSLYVLDRAGRPVPPGTAGELFLGGDGLARGYLGRPELTAERFVPHPWGTGERLYRTGDLARQRPDGNVDFLGRLDDQVKIRGFRIEPGEIEAALLSHPEVRSAVVLPREDAAAARHLAAWVVLDPKAKIPNPKSTLRAWLQERLPGFMVPAAWVVLDALPLTPNGKVDRRALPAPEAAPGGESYAAPSGATEEALAAIFAEVLWLDRVGVDDDFFALGGHSLLATQVVTRVREVLGVELPLRDVFTEPTVRQLAQALSRMV
ncbi:MAG TPA: amino acid adenylation domain-containing protein, partial [Thermoanaerobaculia bacterium]|nr:amino acid adenylation domain-containing protein [Thermoanaerobaculia bacterium]